MKCFNHNDRDSVGMCRICGKALCKECAVTGSLGITCKGDCANKGNKLGDRLATQQRMQGLIRTLSGYYVLGMGILIGFVALFVGGNGLLKYILMIPAIGLILWSIYLIRKNSSK